MMKKKDILLTIFMNGLVPWGLYVILSNYMSGVAALTIATIAPIVDNLNIFIKRKSLDVFGLLMLFTFILTLGLVLLGGGEKILLIKESAITGVIGFIFLVSLLFQRPLMFHLALRFIGTTEFRNNWSHEYFRFVMRLMTFVWGMILVIEAGIRISLVFVLSTATYLAVSNVILYGFIGIAIVWTVYYRSISGRKLKLLQKNE